MINDENYLYGIHAVEEVLKNRLSSVDHVYFDKDRKSQQLFNLIKICRKERLSYNLVPELKLRQLSGTTKHQGVIAICSVKPYCTPDELKQRVSSILNPLLVLPASVEDPGNLGTIIRSCVSFGVDALLLERKNTSPLNAAVAKSSAGMIEHLCIARPKNLEAIVGDYVANGFTMIGTDVNKGDNPQQVNFTGPTILVVGGEHRGIPPYLIKHCTKLISIPLSSQAQSLNVSAATAALLYESARQRNFIYHQSK